MNSISLKWRDWLENGNLRGALRRWWYWVAVAAALVVAALITAVVRHKPVEALYTTDSFYTVQKGPLTISVTSSGNIRSSEAKVIKNEVEGRRTILWLIEEGKHVQKGDLLMEIDSSSLKDEKVDQEIKVETSRANFVTAQEDLAIAKKQGQADADAARVNLQLAILDLEKYTGLSVWQILGMPEQKIGEDIELGTVAEKLSAVDWSKINLSKLHDQKALFKQGEYALALEKAQNTITLAKSELERARDQVEGSSNLWQRGYITKNELQADQLDFERKQLDLSVAESEKRLLEAFTRKRTLSELMSAVDQMSFSLEKAKHKAQANVTDAEAKLSAQKASYQREQEKLEKMNDQIAKCTIRAPVDGMVVYGTTGQDRWDRQEPLDEGVEVRERQELFRLPTANSMTADIKIHESMLKKIEAGLPTVITTDALPGKQFQGTLKKIALMPDSQSRWLNPDLRVYNTKVQIDGDTRGLRPGMSCRAEIIVKEFTNAVYVPIQSVLQVDGHAAVFVPGQDGKPTPHQVEVGLDNNRMVRIVSGLQPGRQVFLTPPLSPASKQNGPDAHMANARPSPDQGPQNDGQNGPDKTGSAPTQGATQNGPPASDASQAQSERMEQVTAEQRRRMFEDAQEKLRQEKEGNGSGQDERGRGVPPSTGAAPQAGGKAETSTQTSNSL